MRSRRRQLRPWRDLSYLVLVCALVWLLAACARPSNVVIPPCPIPTEQAIIELILLEGLELERYIAQIERYCEAIETLR